MYVPQLQIQGICTKKECDITPNLLCLHNLNNYSLSEYSHFKSIVQKKEKNLIQSHGKVNKLNPSKKL